MNLYWHSSWFGTKTCIVLYYVCARKPGVGVGITPLVQNVWSYMNTMHMLLYYTGIAFTCFLHRHSLYKPLHIHMYSLWSILFVIVSFWSHKFEFLILPLPSYSQLWKWIFSNYAKYKIWCFGYFDCSLLQKWGIRTCRDTKGKYTQWYMHTHTHTHTNTNTDTNTNTNMCITNGIFCFILFQ